METLVVSPAASPNYGCPAPPTAARMAVALLFFMNGALFASWVARIPAIQTRLGLSHAMLGFALLGLALGALVAMPLAGWAATRHGSRLVNCIAAVAYCATLPWLALAPNAVLFAFALFCFGAFHGAFDVAMNAQAVAVENRYRRPIMSSFHALWSLGGLTGAALGGLVAAAHISPFLHFTGASLGIGGLTLLFSLPRLLEAGEPRTRRADHSGKRRTGFAWPPRTLVALGSVAFCIMLGEGAMADWSAIYLRDVTGAGEGLAAAGYATFSVAMAGGRFFGDSLAARWGAVAVVRAGSAVATVGLALALLLGQSAAALVGFATVGAGFATIVPLVLSTAGRTSGMDSGPALAHATTLGYMGFLIGPPLIGFIAQGTDLRIALGIVVLMNAVAFFLSPCVRQATASDPGAIS